MGLKPDPTPNPFLQVSAMLGMMPVSTGTQVSQEQCLHVTGIQGSHCFEIRWLVVNLDSGWWALGLRESFVR